MVLREKQMSRETEASWIALFTTKGLRKNFLVMIVTW